MTFSGIFNVLDYGAAGDGIADDSTAFQNCANAAIAVGGKMWMPPMSGYKILTAINITRTISIEGASYQGDYVNCRASSGYNSTSILCGNNGFLNVTSDEPIFAEKFQIVYPTAPAGGVAAITLDGGTTGTQHGNPDSVIRDVWITNPSIGIKTITAYRYTFDHVFVDGANYYSFICQDVNFPSDGDSNIINCNLNSSAVNAHIGVFSGGGLRISNNKMNGSIAGGVSIYVSPIASSGAISPLMINGNSIEGATYGILFQRNSGAEVVGNLVLNNNEISSAGVGIYSQASGTNPWILAGIISGNLIAVGQSGYNISLDGASAVNVASNTLITGGSAATGITFGTTTNHMLNNGNLKGAGVA